MKKLLIACATFQFLVATSHGQQPERHISLAETLQAAIKMQGPQAAENFGAAYKQYTGHDFDSDASKLLVWTAAAASVDIPTAEANGTPTSSHEPRHCRPVGNNDSTCFEQWSYEHLPSTVFPSANATLRWKIVTTDVDGMIEGIAYCGQIGNGVSACRTYIDGDTSNRTNQIYSFTVKDQDKGIVANLYVQAPPSNN